MLKPRSRRKPLGFTLVEILAVTGIVSGLSSHQDFRYAINLANQVKGLHNLRQIHTLLQIRCLTEGYPDAAFYPKDDPKKDPKSILRLLSDAPAELFVSPFAPPALQKKGLTYAWNDTVNGKSPDAVPGTTWLLIDLAACVADPKVEKPSKYLVLYASGKAEAVATPPDDVVRAVKEAEAKAKEKK